MKFHNAELECTFEVPEPLSYRLVLRYDSEVEITLMGGETYERLWRGVQAVAVNWQCSHVGIATNLDDPVVDKGVEAMKWAGLMVFSYRRQLRELPLAGSPESLPS